MIFKGSCTAMVTPFTLDGKSVNYTAFKKQIDFQISNGTSALLFLGTTGEPPTLSSEECIEVANFAVSYVNKRVPVIIGAGSNSTEQAIKKSKAFEDIGADALLHVTPYYNKCTQKGLIKHFTAIAEKTSLPIILYNVPGRTGVNILPETVYELSKIPNIIAIKEASGNIVQMMEIMRLCKNFTLYSGDDGLILPTLAIGGSGIISVASNIIPDKINALCKDFFKGKIEDSRKMQLLINPLIALLFSETNPIPVKAAMNMLNMNAGTLRLPLTEMEEVNKEKLKTQLHALNMLN